MDKKKKRILTGIACALVVGSIVFLSNGPVANLSSSTIWIDNGDGTGYWGTIEESVDNTVYNPPVVINTNTSTQSKSGALIKLEEEFKNLEGARVDLQKRKDEADLALNGPNGSQTKINKLLANLDLYVCTKKAAYKDKGYKYASTIEADTKLKVLSSFVAKYPDTLARLNAELKKIPAKNTTDIQNKKTEIENLKNQKIAFEAEVKAMKDSDKTCIAPARSQMAQLEKTKKVQKNSLEIAQKALDENQDKQNENKQKQEGEKNKNNGNNGGGNQLACNFDYECNNQESVTSCPQDCKIDDPRNINRQGFCGNGVIEIVHLLDPVSNRITNNPRDGFQEQCDDGNQVNGDGCSDTCEIESRMAKCGNGSVEPENNETCDDGNLINNDGCSNICIVEDPDLYTCGDGFKNPKWEQCDDGNTLNGDGCSETCTLDVRAPEEPTTIPFL